MSQPLSLADPVVLPGAGCNTQESYATGVCLSSVFFNGCLIILHYAIYSAGYAASTNLLTFRGKRTIVFGMRINTKKIKAEMARMDLTLGELAARIKPPPTRQGAWYMIYQAQSLRTIEKLARALGIDPKDLIIS